MRFSETAYFGAVMEDRQPRPADDADFWYENGGQPTASKVIVNADSAMRVSAVMSAVRVLAESVAQLDWELWQWIDPKNKQRAIGNYAYDLIASKPNPWQTPFEFKEMITGHLALRGNFYAEQIGGDKPIDALIPLHPDRMAVNKVSDYELQYEYTTDKGQRIKYNQDEIFHVRGISDDGIKGLDPISYARETIGMSLASGQYAAAFYGNSGRPAGVIEHPGIMSPTAFMNFRRSWNQVHSGPKNAGKVAILEQGMKFNDIGMTHDNAQFIEQQKFTRQEIAALFRVPPHMIGDLEFATYSNIEQQSLDFVIYSLMPWLCRISQAYDRDCVLDNSKFFSKFKHQQLLKGDIRTRFAAHQISLLNGIKNVDEVREEEDLNPLPDGKGQEYRVPVNTTPIDTPMPEDTNNEQGKKTGNGRAVGNRFAQNGANHTDIGEG